MTRDAARDDVWRRLRAERDLLDARARDPFGLKEKFRKHPYVFAGLAAGAGALVGNLVAPKGSAGDDSHAAGDAHAPRDEPSPLLDTLRDAALRVATPWIARLVAEHLGEATGPGDRATPAHEATPPN